MRVEIERIDHKFQFEASANGQTISVTASPEMSGEGSTGFRPMQLLLSSLASCLSIDVLNILYKQRQEVESFHVTIDGQRSEDIPSVFTQIDLLFSFRGNLNEERIQRAIDLGMERYCSVYHSLSPNITVNCKIKIDHVQ